MTADAYVCACVYGCGRGCYCGLLFTPCCCFLVSPDFRIRQPSGCGRHHGSKESGPTRVVNKESVQIHQAPPPFLIPGPFNHSVQDKGRLTNFTQVGHRRETILVSQILLLISWTKKRHPGAILPRRKLASLSLPGKHTQRNTISQRLFKDSDKLERAV